MKKILSLMTFASFVIVMMASCDAINKKPDPAGVAAKVCKSYYDALIKGNVKVYVEGMNVPEKIPDGYREELETNMKMFLGQMKTEHGGLKKVTISNAKADVKDHVAQVFLSEVFYDGTKEEIVVPMVLKKGTWYMR